MTKSQRLAKLPALFGLWLGLAIASPAAADPIRMVMLGDSITAGFGLSPSDAPPAKLEAALKARGLDVTIENAGVSGDTADNGLLRLDWSVPEGTQAVIVALGANDMLRGIDPKITRTALTEIVTRLKARGIAVMIAGMLAQRNLGPDYSRAFETIFSDLAREHQLVYYPFLLDGVALDPALNQRDGIHPNPQGAARVAERMAPAAEALVKRVRSGS